MSIIVIQPGDCVVQDPAASKVYAFDWDTTNLPAAVTLAASTISITGLNTLGRTLNLAVTSLVYVDPVLTITTAIPHGLITGVYVTLAGVRPAEFNQTLPAIVTGPSTLILGLGALPQPTAPTGATLSPGLDQVSVLSGAPYNSRYAQFRFTPDGYRGGLFQIANRIVTSETPSQTKELSFQILVQDT